MQSDTVRNRYESAVIAVRAFLARFYADAVIERADGLEDGVLFLVGDRKKTIIVTADFLELEVDEIPEKLAAWNVAHLSRTLERNCRLKITSEGPEEERD